MADAAGRSPSLAELQRQFYDRVVAGAAADGLLASGDLEVYADMYAVRLHDALLEDYPKLQVALGEHRLRGLASSYLRAHPPNSFTLRELGVGFADHLRDHPAAPAWAADLAALERGRMEVFDGPDATPLARDAVIALGERLPELGLAWVPASLRVALSWAVDDLWSAIQDDEIREPVADDSVAAAARVVVVWRDEITVFHRTLDDDEAQLAPQLAAGATFAALCETLGARHGDEASARAVQLLLRWLDSSVLVGGIDGDAGVASGEASTAAGDTE